MNRLNYISVLLLSLFVVGNVFVVSVAADDKDDDTIDVKVNELFELKLPNYSKTDGKTYYWTATVDSEHIHAYTMMGSNEWCFKAVKKGKTTMLLQLYECDDKINGDKLLKTVTYIVNIK